MSKYLAHPKIRRAKPCRLMFASLVALGGFHLLLSTQLTADLTLEWSSGFMFHSLSHTYAKTPFRCVEIVANNALNRRRVVVFDWLWPNASLTLNIVSSLINVHAKWMHCLLISSILLLFLATSIYDRPKWVCGGFFFFFFYIFRKNCRI